VLDALVVALKVAVEDAVDVSDVVTEEVAVRVAVDVAEVVCVDV